MESERLPEQVTLRRTVSPWPELKSLIPTLLFLTFLVAALVWMLTQAFELGNENLNALLAAPVFLIAIFAFKYWQLSAMNTSTSLTLDREGFRRKDGSTCSYACWADVTGISRANTTLVMRPNAAAASSGAGAAMSSAKVVRLVIQARGFAYRLPTKNPVRILLSAYRHGLFSTKPMAFDALFVVPCQFEEDWVHGTIGEFLRYYRPDIALPDYSG